MPRLAVLFLAGWLYGSDWYVSAPPPDTPGENLAATLRDLAVVSARVPIRLLVLALFATAAARLTLEDRDEFGGLLPSAQAFRVGVSLAATLMIIFVAASLGAIALAAILSFADMDPKSASSAAWFAILVLLPPAALAVVLSARFSLASTLAYAGQPWTLLRSWRLTEGRSGRLLATYVIVALAYALAFWAISYSTAWIARSTASSSAAISSWRELSQPGTISGLMVYCVLSTLADILIVAPGPYIYARLARRAEDVF